MKKVTKKTSLYKVQQLSKEDITSVKAMLKAFVFQKEIKKQLA